MIIIIDYLSFSHLDPSSRESMVLMIDNPQQGTNNMGVGLIPSLMGNFDFKLPLNDVKMILVIPIHPKAAILQVALF
jgi:hypothetical protein